jgi:hypothetical protein
MKKSFLIAAGLVALLASAAVFAQTAPSAAPKPPSCYPAELRGGTGDRAQVHSLDSGVVACWKCPDGSNPILAGNANTVLRNVGDRLDTILAASSTPGGAASAASASWSRNVSRNIYTDPEFTRLRAELKAKSLCGWRP